MRIATLAGAICLLVAGSANAQPTPMPGPAGPPATLPPAATAPAPAPQVDPGLAAGLDTAVKGDWSMNGAKAWVNAEYLLWWVTPMNTPNLIQTVPAGLALDAFANNAPLAPGAAQKYFPSTRQLEFGAFSGVRVSTGVNFDRFGIEGSVFYLPEVTKNSSLFNNGLPYSVGTSYTRAGTGEPITLLASLAGQSTGGIQASVSSKLWGADINARLPFYNFLTDSTDLLVGVRYFDLQEKIGLNFRSDLATGTSVLINDAVQTTNHFYGGQVGLNGKINGIERGIGLDTTGKMALGDMQQRATLAGSNTFLTPGQAPDTQAGGLYARGANMGTFSRDKFAMLYEQNVNVTYNFNRWSQVYLGYSIIWVSSVMRPGEAIDPVINDTAARFVAGSPAVNPVNRPAFQWKANDFWTQGITFGLRIQY